MNKAKKSCLWETVVAQLVSFLETADLEPGEKFFSANEISERFDVSNITSRRVLSELAKMDLIDKSRGCGCVIKKKQNIKNIYILSHDNLEMHFPAKSYVYSELYKGIFEECRGLNIELKAISSHFFDNYSGKTKLDLLLLQNFPAHLPKTAKMLQVNPNINCVCCHSLTPLEGISTVRSDLGKGAYDIVSYMINKGHKRIAFLGISMSNWTATRFDGYYRALKDNDIYFDSDLVKTVELTDEAHFNTMDELMALKEPPTAIFTIADRNALSVIKYCKKKKINIPGDLAISGFDNTPESLMSTPPLTTVDAMLAEEGRRAVRLLLEDLPKDKIKDIVVETEIIMRESI
jgi:DNA-binding LacI/PurR family transcriptional regulator